MTTRSPLCTEPGRHGEDRAAGPCTRCVPSPCSKHGLQADAVALTTSGCAPAYLVEMRVPQQLSKRVRAFFKVRKPSLNTCYR